MDFPSRVLFVVPWRVPRMQVPNGTFLRLMIRGQANVLWRIARVRHTDTSTSETRSYRVRNDSVSLHLPVGHIQAIFRVPLSGGEHRQLKSSHDSNLLVAIQAPVRGWFSSAVSITRASRPA